jgi:hypothetical protein
MPGTLTLNHGRIWDGSPQRRGRFGTRGGGGVAQAGWSGGLSGARAGGRAACRSRGKAAKGDAATAAAGQEGPCPSG